MNIRDTIGKGIGFGIRGGKFILGKLGLDRQKSTLRSSLVFNQSFYESQCGKTFDSRLEAIRHFVTKGADIRYSPGPLFDLGFYLDKNPDVAQTQINPLVHFLLYGGQEGRLPHAMFDTEYYLEKYSALQDSKLNPLEHFLRYSQKFQHYNPNPVFSVSDYYANHPEALATGENALVHYLQSLQINQSQRNQNSWKSEKADINSPVDQDRSEAGKLIVCSHDASRTGAPMIILKIVEILKARYFINCKIILLAGGPLKSEFEKYGEVVDLELLSKGRQRNLSVVSMLTSNIIEDSTRIALCNSAESHLVINELASNGVRVLSLIHEFAESYPSQVIDGLYRNSAKLIVPANIIHKSYQEKLGQELPDIEVLPQGIFPDRDCSYLSRDHSARVQARQRLSEVDAIPVNAKIVLGCGYVDNRKGCDYFMLTCQMIQKTNPELNFAFVWVGLKKSTFSDAKFRFWLDSDISRADVSDKLFFVGERPDPTDYFMAADVFYMCSRLDPFPCVVLEAMSAALPVVCFDNTVGSTDLLRSGAGTIIPPFHLLAAAEAITAYLVDDELRIRAGEIGRKLIEDKYQYEHYVEALVERLYDLGMPVMPIEATEHLRAVKKLFIPCNNWTASGFNTTVETLAHGLEVKGWKIEILFTAPKSEIVPPGLCEESFLPKVPHRFLAEQSPDQMGNWKHLAGHIEAHAPCLLLTGSDFTSNAIAPALSERVGVVIWNQLDNADYYEQSLRLGRYANAQVCVSEKILETVARLHSDSSDDLALIPNAVISERELATPKDAPADPLQLICVGRVIQGQKRMMDVVPLVEELEAQSIPHVLTIVCDDPAMTTMQSLKFELKDRVESGTVVFTGRLDRCEVFARIAAADMIILLSDFEGMPIPLNVAMGHGVIPISANIQSGIPELLENGKNGLIMHTRNYAEWASSIRQLRDNSEKFETMSANAIRTVKAGFTSELMLEQFDTLLSGIAANILKQTYHRPEMFSSNMDSGALPISPGSDRNHEERSVSVQDNHDF